MKSYLGSVKWSYKISGVSNKASSSHDLGKEKYMILKKNRFVDHLVMLWIQEKTGQVWRRKFSWELLM